MADKLDNLGDDEILYEEEVLHEEVIDGEGMDDDMDGSDVYIDEGTAGQPVYADIGEGGRVEISEEGDETIEDDSVGGFYEHSDSVYCIAQHPQEPLVITGGGDDRAFIWDWRTQEKKTELKGFKESVVAVKFNMDGKLVAAGDLNGEVRIWDTTTGKESTLEGPTEAIEWLDWHSKGNILLAGSSDSCVYMWTTATGAMMGVFAGHSGSVTCGQFTPDGKKVVTGAEDGTTKVWNPKDQQPLLTFSGHNWHSLPITCLKVKSDSNLFITGSEDSHACVGNIATGKPLAKFTGHAAGVESVGFSNKQNNFVYSGSMDGTLKIWDLNTLQCRLTCTHDEATDEHVVTRIVELDNLVVTGCTDSVVRIWDERTGECVRRLRGHRDVVLDIIATIDKTTLISTSDDTTCRVFTL
eukprot:Phypoly_transcript_04049.p1 GENE.Phypoly_transcript_04049~~Phypoly_transcript_04049.p1  ORF type:complete len:411 (-),score=73.77 Phypoly_transcript_04049:238-1470(-)